jgi:hypothetical protein
MNQSLAFTERIFVSVFASHNQGSNHFFEEICMCTRLFNLLIVCTIVITQSPAGFASSVGMVQSDRPIEKVVYAGEDIAKPTTSAQKIYTA